MTRGSICGAGFGYLPDGFSLQIVETMWTGLDVVVGY